MTRTERFVLRGGCDVLGIRFRPGALTPLLEPAAHELRDLAPLAEDVSPRSERLAELAERLPQTPPDTRARLALDAVRSWWGDDAPDPVVQMADGLVRRSGGRADVASVAAQLGLSPRALERRYRRHAGIPPKLALRIERFRRAQSVLDAEPDASLATVAYRCGYADQAHFTRDFGDLAGATPARWRADRPGVAFVQDEGAPAS
jgi:AraC-like DNA-binding protein